MGFISKAFKKIKNAVTKVASVAAPVLSVAAFALPVIGVPVSAALSTAVSVGAKVAGAINTVGTVSSVLKGEKSPTVAQLEIAANSQGAVKTDEAAKVNVDAILKNNLPTNLVDSNAQLQTAVKANQELAQAFEKSLTESDKAKQEIISQYETASLAAQERISKYQADASAASKMPLYLAAAGIGVLYFTTRKG